MLSSLSQGSKKTEVPALWQDTRFFRIFGVNFSSQYDISKTLFSSVVTQSIGGLCKARSFQAYFDNDKVVSICVRIGQCAVGNLI
jgi:hypothetical protein